MMKYIILAFICFNGMTLTAQTLNHEECDSLLLQSEVNLCVLRNFVVAQRVLDSTYNAILYELSYVHAEGDRDEKVPDTLMRKAIIRSQNSWLKYREDCSTMVGLVEEGGSDSKALACEYKTKLTLDRIRELKMLRELHYGRGRLGLNWNLKPQF